MNLLLWITTPLRWMIEIVLVTAHQLLTGLGLPPGAGVTWVLAILCLVVVVRAALIPVFVRQIRNQRTMLELAPQLHAIRERYRGQRDRGARDELARETAALYRRAGAGPLSSCLPLLVQIPVLSALFETLDLAARTTSGSGVGLLLPAQLASFGHAELFGAPLHSTIAASGGDVATLIVGVVLIAVMTVTQFVTQRQMLTRNASPETKADPMYRQQRALLFVLPLVFVFSGVTFPLGVIVYWVLSNVWSMCQQLVVIRTAPTPGSEAAIARDGRAARKAGPRA